MNKLAGMYELRKLNIPSVDWKLFQEDTVLSENRLWTIRTAVFQGADLHLPRLFGQNARDSMEFARKCLNEMNGRGIVIYYPYLHAVKSGVIQFGLSNTCLEVVSGDIKNLLDGGDPEASYYRKNTGWISERNADLYNREELEELFRYAEYCRRYFRNVLLESREIQMEFSYAYDVDTDHRKAGETRLVFFEVRGVP